MKAINGFAREFEDTELRTAVLIQELLSLRLMRSITSTLDMAAFFGAIAKDLDSKTEKARVI
jgi:hypothetical protein